MSGYEYPETDMPEWMRDDLGPDCSDPEDEAMENARYNLTDLGNAERLVARFGANIRYCEAFGRWYVWDGSRFAADDTGAVMRLAMDTARLILSEALDETDKDVRKKLTGWAMRTESRASLVSMVALAQFQQGVPVRPDELDAEPWVLTVENGTIDLRTQKLSPSVREDLATKMTKVRYEPGATCPTWVAFLNRVFDGDAEMIRFVQRAVGYTLTGSVREQVMFIPHGNGANGKTTFLEILQELLGDFGMQTPPETLMVKGNDGGVPNDVARLKGARFVSTVETEDGKRFSEATVKRLTGGDTVSARFMRAEWFDFRPVCKVWMGTNHKPRVIGNDDGIWRRLLLIPFAVTIPKEERDGDLPAKLRAELSGILNWALAGTRSWHAGGLQVPESITWATEAYRDEQDVMGAFLAACCDQGPGYEVGTVQLFEAYVHWCKENGEYSVSNRIFSDRLKLRGFVKAKVGKARTMGWKGLQLDQARYSPSFAGSDPDKYAA